MKLTELPEATGINEAEREFLENIGKDLIVMLAEAEKAMARLYYKSHLDQEEMLEVWGMLPSTVRSAIKRGNA